MNLTLDLPIQLTDLTGCARCGETTQVERLFRCADRTWICQDCVAVAVEAHRLATVTGRKV
ncbi:hypothetical protein ACFHYQ_09095 [Sphaerimonospora cavernae]|uniref:ClpX-type ZB domain-containing protein n=1 Tax=Sphaerimonospora cavernae TaxID=1740611 RepID=A0ABV6U3L5_9ACTN